MFKQDTNSVFVVRTSKHIDLDLHERERFKYSRVQYQCTHFGTPRVRARCKDLWKIKTLITRMPGLICFEIQFPRKRLEIKKPVWATTILQRLKHMHRNTRSKDSESERKSLEEVVKLNPKNDNFLRMVNAKFNKSFTLTEIRSLKHQCKYYCVLQNFCTRRLFLQVKTVLSIPFWAIFNN